jgi:NADPH-dependent glutamate synthase beta subunit-like oxidoreductase
MEKDQRIAWEAQCIQEEPPACSTTCPLHVDVRQFMKEMAQGNMGEAYKVLRKNMPFTGIFGRICSHPCETKCRRGEVGEALAIGSLERFCVERFGSPGRVKLLPRKSKTVAVVGGDVAGLVAAHDLRKKGYGVTLLVTGTQLGTTLRNFPEDLLPGTTIDEELGVLKDMRVEIQFDSILDDAAFEDLCNEFDAVFLDRTSSACATLTLEKEDNGLIAIDPVTGGTARPEVFAGGQNGEVPIMLAAAGRRGALSIERYLQQAHMTIGRENDGPYETRLYTNLEGIAPLDRIHSADPDVGYTSEEAIQEASRCIQCECLECVKVCQYLAHYKKYPKKYIRQFFNNEKVLLGAAHSSNQTINSCTHCGLCATVCPNGLHMGDVTLEGRHAMLKGSYMPPSAHEFALQDMDFSTSNEFVLCRHQPGTQQSDYLYFPSCQLSATAPAEVLESYRVLCENLTGGVGILLGCCGAPAYWSGRESLFRETVSTLRQQWQAMGQPEVITACCTCQSVLKEHLPEIVVKPLWQVLENNALIDTACRDAVAGQTIAVLDPCSSRHDPETQNGVRRILGNLGFVLEELPLSGELAECCGYGGLVFNANPKLDNAIVSRRAGESDRDYLAYCAMCRDKFVNVGKRTAHLIELLFPSVAGNDPWARGWISWSERRRNRRRVKDGLLAGLGEPVEHTMEPCEKIVLHIDSELLRTLDSRRILENDLRQVVHHAEETGKRLRHNKSGLFRANLKLGHTTFWVDYAPEGEGYRIHNAYSHRMNVTGVK